LGQSKLIQKGGDPKLFQSADIIQKTGFHQKEINMKSNTYVFKKIVLVFAASLLLGSSASSATKKEVICSNNLGSPIVKFCEAEPNILWRGSRPDKDGIAWLINNGVKTIINLESTYDDKDAIYQASINAPGTYKIDYFRVKAWEPQYAIAKAKADKRVIHFLAIANQAKQPIYVHCRAGKNRTGVMIAAYKIILEGRTTTDEMNTVLDEMRSYKGVWNHSTTKYIKGLSQRRDEIIQKVKAFTLEHPTQIICNNGKCESSP
jgi:protein tyrosine/serine phosphatase